MKPTVLIATAMLLLLTVGSRASVEDDIVVIKQHWWSSDRTVPTDLVLNKQDWGIVPVTNFRILSALTHHRIYYFQWDTCLDCTGAVLAVDDVQRVSSIESASGFNAMLRTENISVVSARDAENLAYDFLMCQFIDVNPFTHEQSLRLDIIKSAHEITFASEGEKAEKAPILDRNLGIQPPRLDVQDMAYSLVLYSWSTYTGDILRHTVIVRNTLEIDYELESLASEVGVFSEW